LAIGFSLEVTLNQPIQPVFEAFATSDDRLEGDTAADEISSPSQSDRRVRHQQRTKFDHSQTSDSPR
jgi:uncharacterized protein YndB with AHSA1/START domain